MRVQREPKKSEIEPPKCDRCSLSPPLSTPISSPHLLRHLALERRAREHVSRGGQTQRARGHGPPGRGSAGQQQQRRGGAPAAAALGGDGRRGSAAVVALGVAVIVAVGLMVVGMV